MPVQSILHWYYLIPLRLLFPTVLVTMMCWDITLWIITTADMQGALMKGCRITIIMADDLQVFIFLGFAMGVVMCKRTFYVAMHWQQVVTEEEVLQRMRLLEQASKKA